MTLLHIYSMFRVPWKPYFDSYSTQNFTNKSLNNAYSGIFLIKITLRTLYVWRSSFDSYIIVTVVLFPSLVILTSMKWQFWPLYISAVLLLFPALVIHTSMKWQFLLFWLFGSYMLLLFTLSSFGNPYIDEMTILAFLVIWQLYVVTVYSFQLW